MRHRHGVPTPTFSEPAVETARPLARDSDQSLPNPAPTAGSGETSLDLLPPLERATIVRVDWAALAPEEAKRLQAMGIDEGAEVSVAHRGIFGTRDPLALTVGRMTVAVRRAHARAMTVSAL
jgi:ferrous iron transport protein A